MLTVWQMHTGVLLQEVKFGLVDGAVPFGSAEQFSLPEENARQIGDYLGSPVMWINFADLEQDLPLVSLRDCLHFPEPLFMLLSKAIQYGQHDPKLTLLSAMWWAQLS